MTTSHSSASGELINVAALPWRQAGTDSGMILSSFRSDHSPGAVELVAKCEGRGGPLNALFIVKAANHHQALVGLLTESLDAIAFWHAEFNEDQAKAASLHARVKALLDVLKP